MSLVLMRSVALHRPACGHRLQFPSNISRASFAPLEYGPANPGEASIRSSFNIGPTAVLKQSFGPSVRADARAHASITATGTKPPDKLSMDVLRPIGSGTVRAELCAVKHNYRVNLGISCAGACK